MVVVLTFSMDKTQTVRLANLKGGREDVR
jgi:hypothetical protein